MKRSIIAFFSIASMLVLMAGPAAAQGGQLMAAEYGAGNHRIDVTPQVRSFMHDGMLQFDVNDRNQGTVHSHSPLGRERGRIPFPRICPREPGPRPRSRI